MSDFDPRAYLAKKAAGAQQQPASGFDPRAYLAAKAAQAAPTRPQVGTGEAVLTGLGQGLTLGFGDELGAALQAGMAALTPGMKAVDVYRQARAENRQIDAAAREDSPWAYYSGMGGGVLATAPLLPAARAAKGAGLAARIAAGALTGAGLGTAFGAGASEADLTRGDAGGLLADAATGGVLGAGLGAALPAAGAGAAAAGRYVANRLPEALKQKGVELARKVLTNGADSLSARLKVTDAAAKEALDSGAIRVLGTTEGALERLSGLVNEQGARYTEILRALEARGVTGPNAEELARRLVAEAAKIGRTEINQAIPRAYTEVAEKVLETAGPRRFVGGESTRALQLTEAEAIKRSLQRAAKYGRFEETPLNEARRAVASLVREANEEAVAAGGRAAGGEAAQLAEQFVPAKQRLGRLLEAKAAAMRGTARGAQRQPFGLRQTILAAPGVTSGNLPGAAAGLGLGRLMSLLANRGTSTLARGYYGAGNLLGRLPQVSGATLSRPELASAELRALLEALRRPSSPPLPAVASTSDTTPTRLAAYRRR